MAEQTGNTGGRPSEGVRETSATGGSAAAPDGEAVRLRRDGGVATVVLDRPATLNSLTRQAKQELLAALREVAEDGTVRCLVLTGTGRAFSVGQDLHEHAELLAAGDQDRLWATVPEHYNPISSLLSTMPKPVVAAVNGIAAGAGASFALAADLRLVAASAGFNLAFAGIGLSADSGATYWLPRLVGHGRAMDLLLRPRTVRAQEALALGLATEVVDDSVLAERAAEVAADLAAGPTAAYAAIRRAVAFSASHPLGEALRNEGVEMATTGATRDHASAVRAFLAKQTPTFEGG